jgi:hypothetical protein
MTVYHPTIPLSRPHAKHGYLLALPTVKAKRTVAGYESRNPHLTSYLVTTVYEYATVHVADLFGQHLL